MFHKLFAVPLPGESVLRHKPQRVLFQNARGLDVIFQYGLLEASPEVMRFPELVVVQSHRSVAKPKRAILKWTLPLAVHVAQADRIPKSTKEALPRGCHPGLPWSGIDE